MVQMLTYGRVYATLSQLDKEVCVFFFSLPWIETNTSQLSKYPALNRFDRQLPVPKSYIAVGIFFVFTVVRTFK